MYKEAWKFHKIALPIFTVICLLFYSCTSGAYEVPKDAIIKVYDKDGKQIGEMSRKDYKVVKIDNSRSSFKVIKITRTKTVYLKAQCIRKNTFTVKGGLDGDGGVFGAGYGYKIAPNMSLGGSYINNDTVTVDIGFHF
jgi:hypothetical protein